jgi:hypothetical protein
VHTLQYILFGTYSSVHPKGCPKGWKRPIRYRTEKRFLETNIISVSIFIITSQDLALAMELVPNFEVKTTDKDYTGFIS